MLHHPLMLLLPRMRHFSQQLRYLLTEIAGQELILAFDDLHWAEVLSVELLAGG